ncbi:MAG: exo-alpha-sialidase [Euzebyales bacterium]|nr:exo-alpha-sialidase [Euzebyales bacterium]
MVKRAAVSRRLVPLALVAVLTLGLMSAVQAATPGSGTISPTAPSVTWEGKTYAAGATVEPALCPPKSADPTDAVCDHFTLDVGVDASYWDTHSGGAEVSISWASNVNDFDLYVYQGGELVGSSAQGGTTSEQVVLSKASGTYEVRVTPWLVVNSGYSGTADFVSADGGSTAPPLGGPATFHGTRITKPIDEYTSEPQNRKTSARGQKPLVLKSTDVGREAAEPTIAVNKRGTAFFPAATFDGPGGLAKTILKRSRDGGRTWENIQPQIAGEDSPPITLDPYVYVEEDSGRMFNLDLYVGSSYLSFSDDEGETYETNVAASGNNIVNDHQTLFAGPKPLGSPLVLTDPKFPEILYYCFNRVTDSSCSRSTDGGRTFTSTGLPAYPGVEPMEGGAFCGGLHGHVATDPEGRVMLPKGHCGKPYLSISDDAGTTWTRKAVTQLVDMPDNQSSVASDRAGNLYYVWYDSTFKLPYLATSTDHGKTWSNPLMIAPPNVREVQWPTVAADGAGRIVVSFPGTTQADQGDLTRPWDSYVVVSTNALADNPTFLSNIANSATDPVHRGDCPGRCGNMLDFLDAIVSPASDHNAWATAVDTCTTENSCNSDPNAVGFDEDSGDDNAASDMRGISIRQVSGPYLGP